MLQGRIDRDVSAMPCGDGRGSAGRGRPAGRFVVALGGTATLGKHVARPYPALLEAAVTCPVLNLGALNAGPDHYLADRRLLELAAQADLAILQPGGAEGVTNAFYAVHSRRNDRFLGATPALRGLFPEVDLADIHFTRHLLTVLFRTDPARFAVVAGTLRSTWADRMQTLLRHLPPRRVLLLLTGGPGPAGPYPDLVDRATLAALCGPTTTLVEVALPDAACPPDATAHQGIADRLAPKVAQLLDSAALSTLVLRPSDRI